MILGKFGWMPLASWKHPMRIIFSWGSQFFAGAASRAGPDSVWVWDNFIICMKNVQNIHSRLKGNQKIYKLKFSEFFFSPFNSLAACIVTAKY